MKRTALKRKTPLRASKPMRRSKSMRQRSPRRRKTSPEDQSYLDWLHEQPCAVTGRLPVDVHHNTYGRGLGTKTPHDQGIPLHHTVHMDFHAATGHFKGWDHDRRREWQIAMVTRYQTLWAMRVDAEGVTNPPLDAQ